MNNDLISRKALKNTILLGNYDTRSKILSAIDKAPTVEPERQKGEWKRHDEWVNGIYVGGFYHVNCPNENGYYSKWTTNFCPNCGADMRGKEE